MTDPSRGHLQPYLERLPLIAILRGVEAHEAVAIGHALVDAGFAIIEVPLNSPNALDSIRRLHDVFGTDVLLGAGTVMTPAQVRDVAAAGGRLIVMPHSDADVMGAATAEALACIPGIATPTEGFSALASGADGLKLFPAELLTPTVLRALRAVFPRTRGSFPLAASPPPAWATMSPRGRLALALGQRSTGAATSRRRSLRTRRPS